MRKALGEQQGNQKTNAFMSEAKVSGGSPSPARSGARVLGRGAAREASFSGNPIGEGGRGDRDAHSTSANISAAEHAAAAAAAGVPFGGVLGKTLCGCPAFSNGREGFFGSEVSTAFDMRLPRSPRFQVASRVALGSHASAETWGQQICQLGTKWSATEFVRRYVAQTKGVWLRPISVAEHWWKLDSGTSLVSGERVALRRFFNGKGSPSGNNRGDALPAIGDVIVWQRSREFPFGHVAVVVHVAVAAGKKATAAPPAAYSSLEAGLGEADRSDAAELELLSATDDAPVAGYVDVAEQNFGDMRTWSGRSYSRRLPLTMVRRGAGCDSDEKGIEEELVVSVHDSAASNLLGWLRVDIADLDFSHNEVGDNFLVPVSGGSIRRWEAVRDVTLPWLSPKDNPCDFFVKRSLVVDGNLGEGAVAAEKDTPDGFYVIDGDMWAHIRKATHTLHDVAMAATWKVVRLANSAQVLEKYFGIPSELHYLIRRSLRVLPPMLGRFDFGYDPATGVKMLEYNCDSSAALYECGEVQERWAAYQASLARCTDTPPGSAAASEDGVPSTSSQHSESCPANVGTSSGSFMRQKLLEYWEYVASCPSLCPPHKLIHFMVDDDDEERYTALYVARCAQQCGFRAKICVKLVDFRFRPATADPSLSTAAAAAAGSDKDIAPENAAAAIATSPSTPTRFAVFASPTAASPNESPSRSCPTTTTADGGNEVVATGMPEEDTIAALRLFQRSYLNELDVVDLDGERVQLVYKTWSWDTVLSQYRAQQAERQPPTCCCVTKNPGELSQAAALPVAPSRPSLSDILLNPRIHTIEPFWKMITGSKALLPFMFEHAPDHPNMVYASFRLTDRLLRHQYLSKPVNGRAGQNITMYDAVANEAERMRLVARSRESEVEEDDVTATGGPGSPKVNTPHAASRAAELFGRSVPEEKETSDGRFFNSLVVYQRRVALHKFSNKYYPIFCGWVIGDQFGGVVVREDTSKITKLGSIVAPCRVQR